MNIHKTALVSPEAELGSDVTVGPFAIIEAGTQIGDGCVVDAQAQIRKGTMIGSECQVGSGAILGADPQFLGFDPKTASGVKAGNKNVFREYVTVHRSFQEDTSTIIGDENYLMTGTHIGHDCILGNSNTSANNVLFAGHVEVGNSCFFGGASVFHQFIRIGNNVMTQGMSGFSMDVPSFTMTSGVNMISGLNIIGMRRAGFDPQTRTQIKRAFAMIYQKRLPLDEVRKEFEEESPSEALQAFLQFFESSGKKGICLKLSK